MKTGKFIIKAAALCDFIVLIPEKCLINIDIHIKVCCRYRYIQFLTNLIFLQLVKFYQQISKDSIR